MKAEIREWLDFLSSRRQSEKRMMAISLLSKADTHIRYLLSENEGLEQRVKELEEDEWILVKACLDCSEDMQEVRPGKWQCDNPSCPTNRNDAEGEMR